MALRLYNTMSSQLEEFHPLRDKEVRMYACGPTVYDYGHIGNFRTFIAVDLLQRFFRQSGYKVRYVMNITDLDDKIIRNAAHDGVSVQQYTAKYEKAFLEDAAMIGIEQPLLVRATEHIPEMADFVARLVEKGIAYRTDDGSYYFRIAKFPRYGRLSKKDFSGMLDGARVDVDEYDIAQSESLTGKTFARFWFHVRFLLVEGEKMSKSLGNFYTLRNLVLKGHKPSSIRYLLTSVPYRNQLNFTFDGLKQAAVSVERLINFRQRLTAGVFPSGSCAEIQSLSGETMDRMKNALDDDLNTAQAQAALFEMVRSANAALDAGGIKKDDVPPLLGALEKFDEIFAVLKDDDGPKMKQVFDWAIGEGRGNDVSRELREAVASAQLSDTDVQKKIDEMETARKARNFKVSDALRTELTAAGVVIENTKDGVRWRKK